MVASRAIVEQVIGWYRQAAEANRQLSFRQGNIVVLSPQVADDVLVTADLHGHRLNFNKLGRIADLDRHPRRHVVVQEVCHGGPLYPSGIGCMSHTLLEDVARWKCNYPERVHFILSNHELAELTDFPITKSNRVLNLLFHCGLQEMYGEATREVREAYVDFLSSCPLAVRLTNGIFICHSAPAKTHQQGFDASVFQRPLTSDDLSAGGPVFQLVWGRDHGRENAAAFAELVGAKVLIHGHEPCQQGFNVPNEYQVILDCCTHSACYVMLPVAEQLTQGQVVERIQRLDSPRGPDHSRPTSSDPARAPS